ncbi:MAG: hypothetical protein WBA16_10500 [Nonlabens sp.]
MNIFNPQYGSLFSNYGYGIETLSDIGNSLDYVMDENSSDAAFRTIVEVVIELYDNNFITIHSWDPAIKNPKYSFKSTRDLGEYILNEVFKQDDWTGRQYGIALFMYTPEYLEILKQNNIDINTDWDWFNNEFVPDIPRLMNEKKIECLD